MGRHFAELLFTDAVQAEQTLHGSREQYARLGRSAASGDRLREPEQQFIAERDSFYMAVITENGWPYIQHRGGNPGFLRVLDEQTVGFADLRGNRQYITVGSLRRNDRVALFLMDYPAQARLKLLGRAEVFEGSPTAATWLEKLVDPAERAPAERAIVIHVEAWDWNCPQHITPRYTQAEIVRMLSPMQRRLAELEAEVVRLRGAAAGVSA